MRIENEVKLDFKDVLFKPKRSLLKSRSEVDLSREFYFKHSNKKWKGIPIIASNMDNVGTIKMAQNLYKYGLITCLHKFHTSDEIIKIAYEPFFENVAISCGITEKDFLYIKNIMDKVKDKVNFICVDVANGYSEYFLKRVSELKQLYPDTTFIAGNVVSGEMVEALALIGVDIIKCGIGGGSVCTTRIQTGVGYPQLSTCIECSDSAHGLGVYIISDGGCCSSGDIAKAFGAGSDFVMLGGMLAGHKESGGKIIEDASGNFYCEFYGMSSKQAMEKHHGGIANYRSAEGKKVRIKYRGSIENTIQNILGGVRSTCTYIGAKNLKNLPKCTTFIRCSQQSNEVFGKNV